MKRLGWLVAVLLLAVVGVWVAKREAAFRVLAERESVRADSIAQDAADNARKGEQEARTQREAILALSTARKAAERQARAAQAALHTLLDSVEASAADTSVGRDSLARLVTALAIKIRADSAARAKADSTQDAERLKAGFALAAQVRATDGWREAYERERDARMAERKVTRRSFLSRVAQVGCSLAIVAGGAELGSQVGSAAAGGAGGLLASGIVCK